MARRVREGFNSPFFKLELPKKPPPAPAKPAAVPAPRPKDDERDDQVFLRAMSGVRSLETDERVRVEPPKTLERDVPDDDALALMELESFVRGERPFELSDSEELVWGAAPGVTLDLVHSLQKGEFAFRRHIDLHGMHRDEAHAALGEFVASSRKAGERCVLVITGRGLSSPDGVSVLKETLPRWLSRAPVRAHVLAFCTALGVHGGPGAFYVLLRRQGVRPFGVQA